VPLVPARNPLTGRPPDLGFAVLRSVSPVHLDYMHNMGTAASMSVSLLHDGELWGLIACHNKEPRRLPLHVRTACDLLGQIVSLQITAKEQALETGRRMELKRVESRLLARMAVAERFADGLADHPEDLLRLADARGAAILHEGRCRLVGETPPEDVVRRIAEWLSGNAAETFRTESLARDMPRGPRRGRTRRAGCWRPPSRRSTRATCFGSGRRWSAR
jgi:light-regulated signal transduction histidine kinase (bacteriophytochrome)